MDIKVKEAINWSVFTEFEYMYENETVGELPSLKHEIIVLYEKIDKYLNAVNFAMDVEEGRKYGNVDIEKIKNMACQAAKKMLWLNLVCKSYTGKTFVNVKVDKSNYSECRGIIIGWYMWQLESEAKFYEEQKNN